jgi:hypothetical protein
VPASSLSSERILAQLNAGAAARTSSLAAATAFARSDFEIAEVAFPARYFPARFSMRIVSSSDWLNAPNCWRSGLSTGGNMIRFCSAM